MPHQKSQPRDRLVRDRASGQPDLLFVPGISSFLPLKGSIHRSLCQLHIYPTVRIANG
jgi:hypothetical protein